MMRLRLRMLVPGLGQVQLEAADVVDGGRVG